jgi:hypothetical protein
LPLEETLAIGASIASALSAVHRAGLVHRDVKPANIVDSGGVAKLIDFGIAWEELAPQGTLGVLVDDLPLEVSPEEKREIRGAETLRPAHLKLTETGSRSQPRVLSGTVGYIDPATYSSGAIATARSDLYALGVVLFECITGKHPASLSARAGTGLRQEVLDGTERPVSLASVASGLPKAFTDLVDRMLAPSPLDRPPSADWIAVELERIAAETSGRRRELPPEEVGPFRGLGRFEGEDRDVYFGRSSEIAATLELLRTVGLVALVGTSGSGKSSLARAGVLPRVQDGALGRGVEAWDVVIASPGADPKGSILAGIAELPDAPRPAEGADAWEPTALVAALAARAQTSRRGFLLFVDQLEELVTITPETGSASRAWTAELLAALCRETLSGVRGLVTLRRDLLDPLLGVTGLGKALVRGTQIVEPMSDGTWSEVVRHALSVYGYRLEDEALSAELDEELRGTAEAMPLVMFALTELWNKRDKERKLVTREGLRAIGGVRGSLERHADRTVAELARADARGEARARDVLLRLTTAKGTRAVVDERAILREDPGARPMLVGLQAARLVVATPEGLTLAHDSLLERWSRLRAWLAEVREERLCVEELEADAARWRSDPDGVAPWGKRKLSRADGLLTSGASLSEDARAYLAAGRRAERQRRVARGAVVAALAIAGAASVLTYVRSVRAREVAAVERAELERGKAAAEESRRIELEQAQADLDDRQRRIDALVAELADAKDPKAVQDVQRRMLEAQESAHAEQRRISAIPKRADGGPTIHTAASSSPPTEPKPVGPKIQREDP